MRFTARTCAVAVFAAALVAIPTAHAEPPGWTLVSSSTAPLAARVPGLADAVLHAYRGTTTTACAAKVQETNVFALTNKTWISSTDPTMIAYEWFGTGQGLTSTDCSSGVRIVVSVADYAPAGQPPVVRGLSQPAESHTVTTMPTGAKRLAANATATDWVIYYDGLYQRGESLVGITVKGEYYNTSLKKWTPLTGPKGDCVTLWTQVTPTPFGPRYGNTTEERPCAS